MQPQMKERRQKGRIKLRRTVDPIPVEFEIGEIRGQGRVAKLAPDGVFVGTDQLPEILSEGSVILYDEGGSKIELTGTVRRVVGRKRNPGFFLQIGSPSDAYSELYERMLVE